MMRFRSKPFEVEAVQWFTGNDIEGVEFDSLANTFVLNTNYGKVPLICGDWIITDSAGEKYPCSRCVFEKTYEPLDPNEEPDWLEYFSKA